MENNGMTEESVRLVIWSAMISVLRVVGVYWRMCSSVEIVKMADGKKVVIITD